MKRSFAGVFAVVAVFCLGAVTANADVAFSNYGPGGAYNLSPGGGWAISGPTASFPESIAGQFISAASGSLDTVTVSLGYVSGGSDWVVSLHNDDGFDNVGGALTSWGFSFTVPNSGGGGTITLPYTGSPIPLSAGSKYWVAVAANWTASPDLSGAWKWNSTGDGAPVYLALQRYSTDNGVSWTTFFTGPREVFAVTVVPEPATLATLAIGVVGLGLSRRRRR